MGVFNGLACKVLIFDESPYKDSFNKVKAMAYYVYMLTNQRKTVLYTRMTSGLTKRTIQHKEKKYPGFTQRYNVDRLVYYESHEMVEEAIKREKEIKRWLRRKKEALIDGFNPEWKDLFEYITR